MASADLKGRAPGSSYRLKTPLSAPVITVSRQPLGTRPAPPTRHLHPFGLATPLLGASLWAAAVATIVRVQVSVRPVNVLSKSTSGSATAADTDPPETSCRSRRQVGRAQAGLGPTRRPVAEFSVSQSRVQGLVRTPP
jgi:hypothetical protein